MSFIVKGIDLPKEGKQITLAIFPDGDIVSYKYWLPKDSQAIQIPKGHGKLIDADEFERRCMFDSDINDMQDTIYALRDFPSILEAESHKVKVAYLCDRERCEECHPDYCKHTSDIKHARNFEEKAKGRYVEREPEAE